MDARIKSGHDELRNCSRGFVSRAALDEASGKKKAGPQARTARMRRAPRPATREESDHDRDRAAQQPGRRACAARVARRQASGTSARRLREMKKFAPGARGKRISSSYSVAVWIGASGWKAWKAKAKAMS